LFSFPARACAGLSRGAPGRTRRRTDSDPLLVGLTGDRPPVLVVRVAPGRRRVRRAPPGPATADEGTQQEDAQAGRDEDQTQGQAEGSETPGGMLAAAGTHAERADQDQHCARDRPGQDEPRPQGGRI